MFIHHSSGSIAISEAPAYRTFVMYILEKIIMTPFEVSTREQVSPENQAIFDNLRKNVGFVPNLYATYAYSKNALGR